MYYPELVRTGPETEQWCVKLGDKVMGPAPDKGAAYRIAAYMNGGDFELVLNTTWDYFIGGGVTQPQVTAPAITPALVVDLGHDKPPQL